MNRLSLIVEVEEEGERIDKLIAAHADKLSRSYIQKLLKRQLITVDLKSIKPNYRVSVGEQILLEIPEAAAPEVTPEDIPLSILYEDSDLIIIDKPKGMVVHPSAGHENGTLVNALLFHCRDSLSGINGILRPGIVHRIDRDTTGSLIVCKNDIAHESIAKQLQIHSVKRQYHAIVHGNVKEEAGSIDAPIGRHPNDRKKMAVNLRNGKHAVTHYKVLQQFSKFAYVECELETGRTHQIRVHMSSIGHPLLGDTVYGPVKSPYALQGQTLHAMTIGLIHPTTGQYLELKAPLPDYFCELLQKLK